MGLTQSVLNNESNSTQVAPENVQESEQKKVEEVEPTQSSGVTAAPEKEDETKKNEVFERYVEPPGKLIEVIPADVESSSDVIRKRH